MSLLANDSFRQGRLRPRGLASITDRPPARINAIKGVRGPEVMGEDSRIQCDQMMK